MKFDVFNELRLTARYAVHQKSKVLFYWMVIASIRREWCVYHFTTWKLNLYCISYYILFIFWYIFHFMIWLSLSNMHCGWILVMDSACILCEMILAYFILWKLDLYCISYYILIIFLVYFSFYELIIIIKYALQKLQLCILCKDNVYTQVTI